MNKKKNFVDILFAFLLLAGVASCSNDQPIDPTDHTGAITFGNVSTRAAINSASDIDEFSVFAQQNLGPYGTDESLQWLPLLEGERVYRDDASKEFTYDNTRYWVADRVFHFFAVWPYAGAADSPVTNVSWADGDGAYGYAVTFVTPETADEELLTAKTTVETTTELEFPESVGLNFEHQLTNVNLKIWSNGAPDNVQDKIRVKEVSISNVTKKGTLNTTPQSGSSWSYSSTKTKFTKTYDGDGETVSQAQIIGGVLVPNEVSEFNPSNDSPGVPFGEGLLLIPHTITQSNPVVVTVIYDLQRPIDQEDNLWEEKKLQVLLPEGTWPAGKKLTYNLVISGERTITEFQINTIVEDWKTQTEMIDFTEQVEVRETEKMRWVPGTYESISEEKGEVVLFTDVEKIAVCEFNIRTPIGATWTASLIPLTASAMDAFSIVEDSKYGDVGTDEMQRVKIRINNPDPISARNACLLRITVQTSDGRTIVVKNLMPKAAANNKIEEFTIIQNLING